VIRATVEVPGYELGKIRAKFDVPGRIADKDLFRILLEDLVDRYFGPEHFSPKFMEYAVDHLERLSGWKE
jgi:hypothetical protein